MMRVLAAPNEAEKRRFRVLLRAFVRRFLDNELISAEGDATQTIVHLVALLGAASACLSFLLFMKYTFGMGSAPAALRQAAAWEDREFLISLGMAVTAFLTVVCWDALFPDRRDVMVLCSMPIETRTIFAAKLAAILIVPAIAGVAVNSISGLVFPLVVGGRDTGFLFTLRIFCVHTVSVAAASAFVFFGMLALQGALITLCSRRIFQLLSAYVQLGALFAILLLFFLTPDVSEPRLLTDPSNRLVVGVVPAFWFLGLYQWLLGTADPTVNWLAGLAIRGLALVVILALGTYSFAYRRNLRKIVEDAGIAPPGSLRMPPRSWIARLACRRPVERAIFRFVSRTMRRNRQHRLLLAIYGGVGLAYICDGLSKVVHRDGMSSWAAPTAELASVPLILSFFLLLGMRFLFALPVELRANWLFQITEKSDPTPYDSAVCKVLYFYGVLPLAILPLPVYSMLWGWQPAAKHLVLTVLLQLILVELLLRNFAKIPFTCSYLPGKRNLKATFGVYWTLFSTLAFIISNIEVALLRTQRKYMIAVLLLAGLLAMMIHRRRKREHIGFVYEETPEFSPVTLGLQR